MRYSLENRYGFNLIGKGIRPHILKKDGEMLRSSDINIKDVYELEQFSSKKLTGYCEAFLDGFIIIRDNTGFLEIDLNAFIDLVGRFINIVISKADNIITVEEIFTIKKI